MAVGPIYRLQFTNIEGVDVTCDITDTSRPSLNGAIYDLIPASTPVMIETVDNDENKFTPIKAKQATIRFLSTNQYNLSTFITDAGDDAFYVEVYTPTETVFIGHLVLNDIKQELLDNDTRRTVELKAIDGLGLLKDLPLTKDDGTNPRGYPKIIQYLFWCLNKTGLSLEINAVDNLFLKEFPNVQRYSKVCIQAKTFEDEINTSINCYAALETILGDECYLTQWKGAWWIRRVDEYGPDDLYYYNYPSPNMALEHFNVRFDKEVKLNGDIQLITPAALVSAERPHSFVREEFRYEYPKEIVDNIDFSRGALIQDLGNEKRYAVDDWALFLNSTPNPPSASAYIKRIFEDGYEKERYAVIHDSGGGFYYLRSNPIPVHKSDRITVKIDTKFPYNVGGSTFYRYGVMQVILRGEDGSFWMLHGGSSVEPDPYWNPGPSNKFIYREGYLNEDFTQWKPSISVQSPALPVSGDLEIRLSRSTLVADEIHFSNFNFIYTPYINGSYQKYSGQYSKVSQPGGYRATRTNQVAISDSPKKLFKGALFTQLLSGKFKLAGLWYNGANPYIRSYNGTDNAWNFPLGTIQAVSIWNQYRRLMRLIEANLRGLQSDTELPDLMHTYFFKDNSPHTNKKRFMLLHFQMDLYSCQWSGVFAEVYDDEKGKKYNDPFEFKYIS